MDTLMGELGLALQNCADITVTLEDSIAEWVMAVPTHIEMPTSEIQRLDYLRQTQTDLSVILLKLADDLRDKTDAAPNFDPHAVAATAKLGEIRERVYRAASVVPPPAAAATGTSPQPQDVSDVMFFGDD